MIYLIHNRFIAMQEQELQKKRLHVCPHDYCTSAFDRPYKLVQHLLVHKNLRPFQCNTDNCQKAYTSKSHLLRHMRLSHARTEEQQQNDKIFVCPSCLNKFSNRQNLKRHIDVVHLNAKPLFSCDQCNAQFKKEHQLSSHMYQHTGVRPFSCDLCSESFFTHDEKRRHSALHKNYTCDHCFTVFNHWSAYTKHKREEHFVREYICNECNQKYKKRTDIIRHLKSHDPNHLTLVFQCPHENCCRYYTRKSNLETHIKIKHDNVRHLCTICGASVCTKDKLKYHMRLHDRIEPKTCHYPTKAEGRKERKDKGLPRHSTAARIAGLASPPEPSATPETAVLNCDIKSS